MSKHGFGFLHVRLSRAVPDKAEARHQIKLDHHFARGTGTVIARIRRDDLDQGVDANVIEFVERLHEAGLVEIVT